MKIAVCLYGQPRTWRYCASYIRSLYETDQPVHVNKLTGFKGLQPIYARSTEPLQVDYFMHAKKYNRFNNIVDVRHQIQEIDDHEIDELVNAYQPKRYLVEPFSAEAELVDWPAWIYAGMFRSMFASVLLKQEEEARTGRPYDLVFFQRYDAVCKPGQIHACFTRATEPLTLYTAAIKPYRFWCEAWRYGGNDLLMCCDSLTADLLMAYAMPCWTNPTEETINFWFPYGPNTFLSKAAHHCNVQLDHVHLDLAVVRPGSDMSKPLSESFDYHAKYWVKHSIAMNQ